MTEAELRNQVEKALTDRFQLVRLVRGSLDDELTTIFLVDYIVDLLKCMKHGEIQLED